MLGEILFGGFHSADDSQQPNVLLCVSFFYGRFVPQRLLAGNRVMPVALLGLS
jgi:hypothetical protein